jgi:chaperonin GroES
MSLLRPLADKVIVKLIDENEVVSSIGLVIQGDSKKTTVKKGEVISVGPGRTTTNGTLIPTTVKEGDVVYFNNYEATPVTNPDKASKDELIVVSEQSIYVIVE